MRKGSKNFYGSRYAGMAFVVLIAFYLFYLLIWQTAYIVSRLKDDYIYYAVNGIIAPLAFFTVMEGFTRKRHLSFFYNADIKPFNVLHLIPTILIAVGMFCGLGFVNQSIKELFHLKDDKAFDEIIYNADSLKLLLLIVLYAVLPAFLEESFFRGLMLGNLESGNKRDAIILVSFCFALYHWSITQFVYQFIYGIFLAILTSKARSTVPAMIAHLLNNLAIILFTHFGIAINLYNPIIIAIGLVCLVLACLFLFRVKLHHRDEFDKMRGRFDSSIKGFWLPFGVFGVLLCIAISVLSL